MDPDTQVEACTRTFAVSALFAHAVFALLECKLLQVFSPDSAEAALARVGCPSQVMTRPWMLYTRLYGCFWSAWTCLDQLLSGLVEGYIIYTVDYAACTGSWSQTAWAVADPSPTLTCFLPSSQNVAECRRGTPSLCYACAPEP